MPPSIRCLTYFNISEIFMQQQNKKQEKSKRSLTKSDFVSVLKAVTKPLKQEQGEKESEETSESRHPDDST